MEVAVHMKRRITLFCSVRIGAECGDGTLDISPPQNPGCPRQLL